MLSERLKAQVPWPLKIAAKMVLARLPVPHQVWQHLNLFRDGAMDVPEVAYRAVRNAAHACGFGSDLTGLAVLELGPGDAISTAVVAAALGARSTVLIDATAHARRDMEPYRRLLAYLRAQGLPVEPFLDAGDIDELLRRCRGSYWTGGLADLERLEPQSIDLAFSTSVLEHVRLADFEPTVKALARALSPRGRIYHSIDFLDHLGGSLNHLRFSPGLWESDLMAASGFYTNRLRWPAMLEAFRSAGLVAEVKHTTRFTALPLPRHALARPFRGLGDEDLLVNGINVVLTPAQTLG